MGKRTLDYVGLSPKRRAAVQLTYRQGIVKYSDIWGAVRTYLFDKGWLQQAPGLDGLYCRLTNEGRVAYESFLNRGRGERNANARLTAEQVRQIRDLRSKGWTLQQIARRFVVDNSHINLIVKRKRWTHI